MRGMDLSHGPVIFCSSGANDGLMTETDSSPLSSSCVQKCLESELGGLGNGRSKRETYEYRTSFCGEEERNSLQ